MKTTILLVIIFLLIVLSNIISTAVIVLMIEKHSVHPVYMKKVENASYTCNPWDAC
jgi:hypothetical protein